MDFSHAQLCVIQDNLVGTGRKIFCHDHTDMKCSLDN